MGVVAVSEFSPTRAGLESKIRMENKGKLGLGR